MCLYASSIELLAAALRSTHPCFSPAGVLGFLPSAYAVFARYRFPFWESPSATFVHGAPLFLAPWGEVWCRFRGSCACGFVLAFPPGPSGPEPVGPLRPSARYFTVCSDALWTLLPLPPLGGQLIPSFPVPVLRLVRPLPCNFTRPFFLRPPAASISCLDFTS